VGSAFRGANDIFSYIHSSDLYGASSRDYYSEALPTVTTQPITKRCDDRKETVEKEAGEDSR